MTAYQSELRAALCVNGARNSLAYTARIYAAVLTTAGEREHAQCILDAVENAERKRFAEASLERLDKCISAARRHVAANARSAGGE